MFTTLSSSRLLIRPYQATDAPALHAAIVESRDHLRPWEAFADWFQTLAETTAWIERRKLERQRGTAYATGLWLRTSGQFVGGAELFDKTLPGEPVVFMLAYWLRKSAQGNGYITEAVCTLSDYAFTSLRAMRVYLEINARNRRSIAVAERTGFAFDPVASATAMHLIYTRETNCAATGSAGE